MKFLDIVYDAGSTTKAFRILSQEYKLEVIFSAYAEESFKRIIVIYLDKIPVMVALSKADKSSPLFLDILANSNTTPIGVRLFAKNSGISRSTMIVKQGKIQDIKDHIIRQFIAKFMNDDELIYYRYSNFSYQNQSMDLDEYVLPGLELIVDKYERNQQCKDC